MKQIFKIKRYMALLILAVLTDCKRPEDASNVENWIPLFNGKDLTGWDIKIAGHEINDNYKNTYRVEDGMIRIMYDQYENFDAKYGHMYYQHPKSYYKLRFQYRFTGDQTPGGAEWNVRNSGVMVHSQSVESVELSQDFPVSLEMQLLGGLGQGSRPTGNICTPGTQIYMGDSLRTEHCINSTSKTYDGDQWVNAMIEVYGDSLVRHIIEGDTVFTYSKPIISKDLVNEIQNYKDSSVNDFWKGKAGAPLKEGYIALQAESHAIDFRNVELLDLQKN
jgi:hypothetical protein